MADSPEQILIQALNKASSEARFDLKPLLERTGATGSQSCGVRGIRQIVGRVGCNMAWALIGGPHLSNETLSELVEALKLNLPNHSQSGKVSKEGLDGLLLVLSESAGPGSRLKQLAIDSTRATVYLEPREIVRYVRSWDSGEPLVQRRLIVFSGISLVQAVSIDIAGKSYEFKPMPANVEEIRRLLPDFLPSGRLQLEDLLGLVVMETDEGIVSEKFFDFESHPSEPTGCAYYTTDNPFYSPEDLSKALSLASGTNVQWVFTWVKKPSFRVFGLRNKGLISYKTGPISPDKIVIDGEHLDLAKEVLLSLESFEDRKGILRAIERWTKSKASSDLEDQLIDLRVAMDIAFLDNSGMGEMIYRISSNLSWLIGEDSEKRLELRKDIRRIYNRASRAVHGGEAKSGDQQTLEEGQKLCRLGITKLLEQGKFPDWDKLTSGE